MIIKHYLYNTFTIEHDRLKIAIDPGLCLSLFRPVSLLPRSEWASVTHILVTHGDPDHEWNVDRVARASGAPVICGKDLVKRVGRETLLLSPRRRGLRYDTPIERIHPIEVGEVIELEAVRVKGLKAVHGPVGFKLFGFMHLEITPRPGERIGRGAMGFEIEIDGTVMVNLGDSLLQLEWEGLHPDVLMLPIGGRKTHNVMDERDALEAVRIIGPKIVIPCHYNLPVLLSRRFSPADEKAFKFSIEKMGIECRIMRPGDELTFT